MSEPFCSIQRTLNAVEEFPNGVQIFAQYAIEGMVKVVVVKGVVSNLAV
jgi:hypothetical protein